jgi:trehalose 6-phosphate phosphatase
MGVDDLVVTGSHGFDIWSPDAGTLEHEASSGFDALLERVRNLVQDEAGGIEGASIEPKKASVAVHYRLVSDSMRPRIKPLGTAVLHLLEAVDLDREEIVALDVGDDIIDEQRLRGADGSWHRRLRRRS